MNSGAEQPSEPLRAPAPAACVRPLRSVLYVHGVNGKQAWPFAQNFKAARTAAWSVIRRLTSPLLDGRSLRHSAAPLLIGVFSEFARSQL